MNDDEPRPRPMPSWLFFGLAFLLACILVGLFCGVQ